MRQTASEILFAYWNELRAGQSAPRRVDIEPSRISTILPQTFIVEHHAAASYRFRLAGTRICEQHGQELRGQDFLGLWQPLDQHVFRRQLELLAAYGGAAVTGIQSQTANGRSVVSELTVLPLCDVDGEINRFMGAWSLFDQAEWSGTDYLTSHQVTDYEFIDPDSWSNRNVVMAPPQRTKLFPGEIDFRVVKSEHRRFRVYRGGLDTTKE